MKCKMFSLMCLMPFLASIEDIGITRSSYYCYSLNHFWVFKSNNLWVVWYLLSHSNVAVLFNLYLLFFDNCILYWFLYYKVCNYVITHLYLYLHSIQCPLSIFCEICLSRDIKVGILVNGNKTVFSASKIVVAKIKLCLCLLSIKSWNYHPLRHLYFFSGTKYRPFKWNWLGKTDLLDQL